MTAEESTPSTVGKGPDEHPRSSIAQRHPVGLAVGSGLAGLVVGAFGAATLIGLWAPPPPPPGWGPPPPPPFAWHPPPPPPGAWGFPPPGQPPQPAPTPPPPPPSR